MRTIKINKSQKYCNFVSNGIPRIAKIVSKDAKLHGMHKPYALDFGKNKEILENDEQNL